ncbi:MAG: YHS domain-containing protein [Chloroflexi bacterium]|nr:YHS domain-containing protein [Chloroflexota bacterium]
MEHQHQHDQAAHASNEHIDPVCGMTVVEGREAARAEHNGDTYYFCGKGCQVAFNKNPEKFLKEGPSMQM